MEDWAMGLCQQLSRDARRALRDALDALDAQETARRASVGVASNSDRCRRYRNKLRQQNLIQKTPGDAQTDARHDARRGGEGGVLPSRAQPEKEYHGEQGNHGGSLQPTSNGQHALFEKTVERATPKPRPPKKQFPPMPPDLACDARLVEAWQKWVTYRREMGKPVTPTGQAQAFAQFTQWGPESSVRAIEHTIFSGWQGLQPAPFEIRGGGAAKPDVREKLNAAKRRDMDA